MKSFPANSGTYISPSEKLAVRKLLRNEEFDPGKAEIDLLTGDGSERRFLRVSRLERSLILILPNLMSKDGLAESRSTWLIGNHLRSGEIPVPEMYGYDAETGVIACEDLGDSLLHKEITSGDPSSDELYAVYEQAIKLLVRMQVVGGEGFKKEWCWQTGVYDRGVMLSGESGYFMKSFCRDFLGISNPPAGLDREFAQLAELASAAPAGFFLHRDFQSRNIMLQNGGLRIIDFQGGRLGPLAYDLASLLIDPYAALPEEIQENLLRKYVEVLADYPRVVVSFRLEDYYPLALQRNLQILGAFAFLSKVRGKIFFQAYLEPALFRLKRFLGRPEGCRFPVLRGFTEELAGMLNDASG